MCVSEGERDREKEKGTVCREIERERERAKIVRGSVCVEIEIGSV